MQCKLCGEEFTPKRSNSIYCEKKHYRLCLHCGESYLVKRVANPPLFCSVSCAARHRSQEAAVTRACVLCGKAYESSNNNSKYCPGPHEKLCKTCGKVFPLTSPTKANDYCSWACSIQGKRYEKLCKRCGEPFVATNKKTLYCSRPHYSTCEGCGQSFALKHPKRLLRFCSLSCANQGRAIEKTCALCGEAFTALQGNALYCERPHYLSCVVCGTAYPLGSPAKPSQTCSKNCAAKLIDFPSRQKKTEATLQERYGVSNSYQLPQVLEKLRTVPNRKVSKLNRRWQEELERELAVPFALEVPFGEHYSADLAYGNVLVDLNPTVSHNSSYGFLHQVQGCEAVPCLQPSHAPLSPTHHQERFLAAEAEGKVLLQWFEWMDPAIFMSVVRAKAHRDLVRMPARKCELREVSQRDANRFLRAHHLLGAAKGQSYCVGLFHEGELVHLQTYGPARFTKRFQWEAIRSCSRQGYHVQGGFSRCDKAFFRSQQPKSVVSYVDLALGGGATEAANPGWKLVATNKPSATWCFLGRGKAREGKPRFLKEGAVRRLSADKLLGLAPGTYPSHHADGSVFTNEEVLLAEGYGKVFDVGTRTFAWEGPRQAS